MEFFNSKKFIIAIVLVLFFTALSGCARTVYETKGPRQPTTLETVGKMKGIVSVLGCMFAPASEECKKLRTNQPTDKEDQERNDLDSEGK